MSKSLADSFLNGILNF